MAEHGNDGYDEAGEEFRPGREGEEYNAKEERMEELRRRKERRERKEEEERIKKSKEQGARSKTKKSDGKTYKRLETTEDIELKDLGEEERRRRLERVVQDVKIEGNRKMQADIGEAAQKRVTRFLDGIFEKVKYEKILVAISEFEDKFIISLTDKGSIYYALDRDGNFEDGKEHKKTK